MIFSLVHILLLLAATLGVWLARPRPVVMLVCFMLFPLPAALFHLYAAPDPVASLAGVGSASATGCARGPQAASNSPASAKGAEPAPNTDCGSALGAARTGSFLAVIAINYLTVLIGALTGLLALLPGGSRQRRGSNGRSI